MKVWKIYSKNETENGHKYELYAVTNKRAYIDTFKFLRNMNRFIVKKDDWSKEEYAEFVNDNLGLYLNYMPVKTKSTKDGEYIDTVIDVLMTNFEFDSLAPESVSVTYEDPNWWEDEIAENVPHFQKKIIKALDKFFFFAHQKLFDESHKLNIIEDDYSFPDYELDQLSFFVLTNKKLLK